MSMVMEQLKNRGIIELNAAAPSQHRTVIVVGVARSGTSMIGAVLSSLGVFMGERANRSVYEDTRIADALEKNPDDLPALIAHYNASHDLWGFKRPMAFRNIGPHLGLFRNPCFIVIFRDPLAVALRNNISMGHEFEQALRDAASALVDLVSFVSGLTQPTLLVSYEKALANPSVAVAGIAGFVGVEAPVGAIGKATRVIANGPDRYLLSATRSSIRRELGL